MKKKLFVFDIDGTLLPAGQTEIPPSAIKSINALLKQGHAIAINSGRPFNAIKYFLSKFDDGEKYIIAVNGAALYKEDGTLICEETLPLDDLVYFHDRFKGEGKDVYAYAKDNKLYVFGSTVSLWAKWEIDENKMDSFTDLNKVNLPNDTRIYKVMVCGPSSWIPLVPFTNEEKEKYHIIITGPEYLEIMPKHVDKSVPIRELCKRSGIEKNNVYCFGDSGNDIGMLKEYHGIAMGEATSEAYKAAEFHTKASYEDGIAYALKEILKAI